MKFDYSQSLGASTDTLVTDCLGSGAIKTYEDRSDDFQNGSVVYRIGRLEILIWRDRGLHTIHMSKLSADIKHSIFTLANHIGKDIEVYTATERVDSIESQLTFIRLNIEEIERVLTLDNTNEGLDYIADYKGINFGLKG